MRYLLKNKKRLCGVKVLCRIRFLEFLCVTFFIYLRIFLRSTFYFLLFGLNLLKMKFLLKKIPAFTLFILLNNAIFAQEYGLKVGTNWSIIQGEKEKDANGNVVGNYTYSNGYHFGFMSSYPISDNIGVQIEMLFASKSMNFDYEGEAFRIFYTNEKRPIVAKGKLKSHSKVTNAYFEIPLMLYVKKEGGLDFAFGFNCAFLAGSTASGESTFSGNTEGGFPISEFGTQLNFNYSKDSVMTVSYFDDAVTVENGNKIRLPKTQGAYYDSRKLNSPFFNKIDISLAAEMTFWLNEHFGLSGRATYSIFDVTNNEGVLSHGALDANKNYTYRQNTDRIFNLQAALKIKF